MNKSKRLLSVLLCLAMLMSSLSSFAFAGEVITETEAGYLSSGSATNSNAVTAGPNPTTNETIDINGLLGQGKCYVVDKNATEPYILEWDGKKYEGFKVNETVFKDINEVQELARDGSAILVKNIGSQIDLKITRAANYYTEAYNTMPYTIGAKDAEGNALPIEFDGSDWVANPEFTKKSQTVSAINIKVGGEIGLYGFTFKGQFNMSTIDGSPVTNVKLQNSRAVLSSSLNPLFTADALAQAKSSVGSSLEVKNIILTSNNTTVRTIRLLTEWYVDTVTFDGMFLTPTVNFSYTDNWIKQGNNNQQTVMTFKNSNFRSSYNNKFTFQGKNEGNFDPSTMESRTLNFENNIFFDFRFSSKSLMHVSSKSYSHINFINNRVLSSVPISLFSEQADGGNPCVYKIVGNYLNGVDTTLQTKAAGRTISPESVIKENYTYKKFTLSENAVGKKVIIDADTDYECTSYYIDQKMTVLNTDLEPVEISNVTANEGSANLNQNTRTIIYNLPKDKTAKISFTVPEGATYKWYTNAECTNAVDISTVKGGTDKTLYVKVSSSKTQKTLVYTVKVITSTNLFSETFEGDDTITKDIYLVTNRYAKVSGYKDYTTFEYKLPYDGKTYTFIKGVNAFTNLDDVFEYADVCDVATPVIYFDYNAPTEEIIISHSAKIYAPNYNVSPFDNKGWTKDAGLNDGTGDKAWTYNTAYDKNKRTVGGIKITGVVNPALEVHGLELVSYKKTTVTETSTTVSQVGGGINATGRNASDKATNFVFANILMNDTLDQPIKFSSTKGISGDKALFNNMYFQSSYKAGNMQFTANFLPQTTVIDGLFIDFDNLGNGNTPGNWLIKQNNSSNSITFKNCNIRNMKADSSFAFHFRGYADDKTYGANSKISFDHNILYNFSTGTITKEEKYGLFGFYSANYANYSSFVLTNNYITAPNGTSRTLFSVTGTTSVPSNDLNLQIKDNIILGIDGYGLSRAIGTSSEISGNYITNLSTDDKSIVGSNLVLDGLLSKDYYLDYDRKILNTNIIPISAKFKGDATLVKIDNFGGKIMAGMETYGVGTLAELEIKLPTIADAKWYFDKAMTTEITSAQMSHMTVDNCPAYLKIYVKSNPELHSIYKVHLVSKDSLSSAGQGNTFVANFTDDLIDSTKALLVTNEFKSTEDGYAVSTTWADDTVYVFVKGKNLFDTLEAAIEYAKSNNIKDPNFLLKDLGGASGNTNYNIWKVKYPGKYFTRNYNKMPYVKGTKQDGSDWVSNVNTGKADAFDTTKGITVTWLKFNTAVKGNYEFYGFTLKGVIQDDLGNAGDPERSPEDDINVKIENLYWKKAPISGEEYAGFLLGNHFKKRYVKNGSTYKEETSNKHTTDINQYNDSMTLKNVYLDNSSKFGLFANSDNYLWRHVTIDGLYVDHAKNSKMASADRYLTVPYDDYSFTIKNSNIRNFNERMLIQGHNDRYAQFNPNNTDRKAIVLENNIFYKYNLYSASMFLDAKHNFHNELTIKNNYIHASTAGMTLVGKDYTGNNVKDMVVTITDNVLIGFNTTVDVGRKVSDSSVAEKNYIISTIPTKLPDSNGVKLKFVSTNKTIQSDSYYTDSEKKSLAGELIPLEFVSDDIYEINGKYYYHVNNLDADGKTADGVYTEAVNASSKYEYTLVIKNLYKEVLDSHKITMDIPLETSVVTHPARPNQKTTAGWKITTKATTPLNEIPVYLKLSLDSDATKYKEYHIIVTKTPPIAVLDTVTVGGNEATKQEDGKFSVLLSKDGKDEALVGTGKIAGSVVKFFNARNQEVTNVSVGIGETKEYKVTVEFGGAKVEHVIVVTRGELGAEDVIIPVLNEADDTDTSNWLPALKESLDDAVYTGWKTVEDKLGQKAMEEAAAEIEKAIKAGKALTRTKYDEIALSLSKVNNDNGKYCENTFENFKTALKNAKERFETVASKAAYDSLITDMEAIKSILKTHSFTNYKHIEGSENCVSDGKMTAKCDTNGCSETKTVKETGNFKNDSHVYGAYKYNGDATALKDGTKTATCEFCGNKNTVTATGTKTGLENSAKTFKDVDAKGWYKEYVDYAVTYGLMNGTSDTTFAPTKTITRAEFVQVLANMSGVKTTNNNVKTKFTDVKEGAWYAAAVKWASDNGIVNGTSATTFAPTDVITREQMCVMLVGYANYQKITLKKAVNKVTFPDDAKISTWAKNEVYACQMAGIVSGKDTGFAPKDTATRAEVSVIVSIFHKDYILK